MRVCFVEPHRTRQGGGLGRAIRCLREAMSAEGVSLLDETALDGGAVPDLVHFHGLWEPRHWILARRCHKRRLGYLVSPHGMLEPWAWRAKRWKKRPYFHLFERGRLVDARALLATADEEAEHLRRLVPSAPVFTLPLGLTGDARPAYQEARRRLGWDPEERVLVFLSRIHPKKGLDILIQALEGHAQGRLVIVGGGSEDYVAHLRELCRSRRAALPRVDWMGEVLGDERWAYLQGADLFCLPSHSENFALAVLEACQVGTPVLTTTETPWARMLAGRPAFICDPSVESVRQALGRFWAAPVATMADRSGLAAWAWQTFSWKILGPRYAGLYSSLASS
jgi:glycosyltransferase involved in cell wall biosynthesis